MAHRDEPDRWLFGATLALSLFGATMVFSASAVTAQQIAGNPYVFLLRQLLWLGCGFAGMLTLWRTPYQLLARPAVVFGSLAVGLLLLAGVFALDKTHATHRWLRLGAFGFQPAEFVKLAVVLYLSWLLALRTQPGETGINDLRRSLIPGLGPVVLLAGMVVVEPDLGTAAELFAVALVMLFAAGLSLRYLGTAVLAALPALYLLVVFEPYRYHRLMAFLHPEADPQGHGFQLLQSLIAVGSGGITGLGLMAGRQKLFYLPEAHTDFIFAVICEELGLVGALAVLALFGVYTWRGIRASQCAPDPFGRFLSLGMTTLVAIQALTNMSVVLGLLPTKGLPLPFVSYGGSSLVILLLGTGILLNILRQAEAR
jgi:cell division protein FtsW